MVVNNILREGNVTRYIENKKERNRFIFIYLFIKLLFKFREEGDISRWIKKKITNYILAIIISKHWFCACVRVRACEWECVNSDTNIFLVCERERRIDMYWKGYYENEFPVGFDFFLYSNDLYYEIIYIYINILSSLS